MKFIKTHLGLALIVPLIALTTFFPLHDGGILPDPWETLLDWTGEIVAYSYLATIIFLINSGWIFVVAALLDRCPLHHGILFIFPMAFLIPMFFFTSFGWQPALVAGLMMAVSTSFLYLLAGLIKRGIAMRSSESRKTVATRSAPDN